MLVLVPARPDRRRADGRARAPATSATYRHADPAGPADPGARVGSDVAGARARPAAFAGDDGLLGGDFDGADPRGRWLLEFARLGFTNRPEADHRAVDEDVLAGLPAVFRSLGDRWGEAAALSALATRALYRGDLVELRHNAEAGARMFAELGDEWGRLQASEQLGILAEIGGDYPEAARLHEEGVRSARVLELFTQVSFGPARQGRIALLTGDTVRAADLHGQARLSAEEQAHRPALQFAEIGLALGARRAGDLDAAEARLLPWLDWNRRLGVDIGVALILAQLGYVAELRGDVPLARTLHRDGLAAPAAQVTRGPSPWPSRGSRAPTPWPPTPWARAPRRSCSAPPPHCGSPSVRRCPRRNGGTWTGRRPACGRIWVTRPSPPRSRAAAPCPRRRRSPS